MENTNINDEIVTVEAVEVVENGSQFGTLKTVATIAGSVSIVGLAAYGVKKLIDEYNRPENRKARLEKRYGKKAKRLEKLDKKISKLDEELFDVQDDVYEDIE